MGVGFLAKTCCRSALQAHRRSDAQSVHRCGRLQWLTRHQMGAAIEREATAVLKDAEQLVPGSTPSRNDGIDGALRADDCSAFGSIIFLDSAPVWELRSSEFTRPWTAIACSSRGPGTRRTPLSSLEEL